MDVTSMTSQLSNKASFQRPLDYCTPPLPSVVVVLVLDLLVSLLCCHGLFPGSRLATIQDHQTTNRLNILDVLHELIFVMHYTSHIFLVYFR